MPTGARIKIENPLPYPTAHTGGFVVIEVVTGTLNFSEFLLTTLNILIHCHLKVPHNYTLDICLSFTNSN